MLKLSNIVKTYDVGDQSVNALRGIDVAFRKNEFVSILGPSGCGKTTLMNIIGGLDQYTSGDLIINGQSTKEFKDINWDNYRNKRIGFVFQSYNLIMHQTVLGNVELALTLSGISPSERKARAIKILEEVGLHDQLYKKPNQLSGGQMQRVAIARALVNEPEILLADEPTGALDTETSIQILDLIKKVAEDRLVIMVTHNSDLAHQYSNRVINMLDGKFIDDSNPYESKTKLVRLSKEEKSKTSRKEKTAMSFLTALTLSFKNLLTKKWRTVLTAVAGSIGIIGVSLILAVSSGTNNYVAKVQADTLSSNPLEISEHFPDPESVFNQMNQDSKLDKFPFGNKITGRIDFDMTSAIGNNKIDDNFNTFQNKVRTELDPNLYNDLIFSTGMNVDFYGKVGSEYISLKEEESSMPLPFSPGGGTPFQILADNEFVATQYDILKGRLPVNANELVIVVNEYNEVSISVLKKLGIIADGDEVDVDGNPISVVTDFDALLASKLYIAFNNEKYSYDETKYVENLTITDINDLMELNVTGIIRINQQTSMGMIGKEIGYTKALRDELQEINMQSDIALSMQLNLSQEIYTNPLTGSDYFVPPGPAADKYPSKEMQMIAALREFGGDDSVNNIKIFAKDFESKESIKKALDGFNKEIFAIDTDDYIIYFDMAEIFGAIMNQIINIITIILVAFTSISLVVSSIMIGIITYVSVLERNKEIGILRSIGARKKDITRVFNAETFIIGVFSGIIGIGTTYLVSFPANIIIKNLSDVDNIASLPILSALVLIVITVGLTVLAGLIPARGAAKKDPVEALRTE